jgi:hypothetical protein
VPTAAAAQHAPVEAASLGTALVAERDPRTRLSIAALYVLDRTVAGTASRHAMVVHLAGQLGRSPATLRRAMRHLADHRERSRIERRQRSDAGAKRVHFSGRLDTFAVEHGVDPRDLPALADKLNRSIKGAWQDRASRVGWRTIRHSLQRRFTDIFRSFGASCALDRRAMERLVPKHAILRFRHHMDVAIAAYDAGRHYNEQKVPVRRTAESLSPADVFCIDATVGNIKIICEDGVARSPKIVGVMDVYSGYTLLHVIRPEARRAARQADGFVALAKMMRILGVPRVLQRDNGKEFDRRDVYREIGAMVRHGLLQDAAPTRDFDLVARPYNAGAKPIERVFRKAQAQGLAVIEGDHGGDWSDAITQRQGQEPEPYPGTYDDFVADVQALMNLHNCETPWATGWHAGKTPVELIEEARDRGRLSILRLADEELGFLFSRRDTRTVQPKGRIDFEGYTFHATALASEQWVGRVVEVRWPLVGHDHGSAPMVHVVDPKTGLRICTVTHRVFGFLDDAGFGHRRELDKEQRTMLAAKRAEADGFDIGAEQLAVAKALAPTTPFPALGTATITPDGMPSADGAPAAPRPLVALDDATRRRKAEKAASGQRSASIKRSDYDEHMRAVRARLAG